MTNETAPSPDPVSAALAEVLVRHAGLDEGAVADYIPELATADPTDFGIARASVHGRFYRAGDADVAFTIQSSSKPFVFALAVHELGLDAVVRHVGLEPSGEPFNAISLEETSGRPANPLINAGAIVTSALVPGADAEQCFERVRGCLSAFAGRELHVDERVYRSEDQTGDRNRALAYLALATGALPRPVEHAVEVYFRQCALDVTAADLAVMGATLANAGVNPLTGEQVVDEWVAMTTMSVMATCGMYDASGEWLVRVGLPAKSGVGGGIAAVQSAQFGIGVYSPLLDAQGNSVRGVATLETLSREFGLHLLAHPTVPRSPIESSRSGAAGHRLELRGELDFLSAEEIAEHLVRLPSGPDGGRMPVVLDVSGVTRLLRPAERLLAATAEALRGRGLDVQVLDPSGVVEGVEAPAGTTLRTVAEA